MNLTCLQKFSLFCVHDSSRNWPITIEVLLYVRWSQFIMTLMVTLLPCGSLRGTFMHLCPNLEEVTMKTNSKLAFPQLPQRTYISKSNLMYEYSLSLSLTLLYAQSESHLSDHASILNRYCHFDSLMEFCCLKVVCYFKYLPFSVNVLSASF